uniref:Uncharacterized protein n=1 Tax=Triticum urartu TaxID=4572 RepID=A0A8R7PWV0_TRIUA
MKCTPELAHCQSVLVLNHGHGGGNSSYNNVIEGIHRKFIEKLSIQHEGR